jgi:chromate transporter
MAQRFVLAIQDIKEVDPGAFITVCCAGRASTYLATLAIFLPSFIFVALSNPLIPRIRNSAWVSSLLDGVNVASLGLMAAVTWQLGRASLIGPLTILIALSSFVLLIWFKVNSTWLILDGGFIGLLSPVLR